MSSIETIKEQRVILAQRREALRGLYARFRDYGHRMSQKGLVRWEKLKDGYRTDFLSSRSYKERETINKLFNLQRNITHQAMLLLELEHALDQQEKKEHVG